LLEGDRSVLTVVKAALGIGAKNFRVLDILCYEERVAREAQSDFARKFCKALMGGLA